MKAFLRHCRGVLVFSSMTVNTIFWFVPIVFLAIIKLLLPIAAVRRFITRCLMVFGEKWISTNTWILKNCGSIDWQLSGAAKLQRNGWYLVIANHQSWVDIVLLQECLNRRVPFLKFFIKQELIWFPFLGIAWWAMDMPFMKRYSPSYLAKNPHMKGKDLETTQRACLKFRETPTSVINFVEGTRFSPAKQRDRKSPYEHLLVPRAGGLAIAISAMGELFNSVLDMTIHYSLGPAKFWDMCCGTPVIARVSLVERELPEWLLAGDYQNDRAFRKRMHQWLGDIWAEKDATIGTMTRSTGTDL